MSHLIAPTHTLADNIPLGRRITEIMTEKGPAYTIAAMAKRLGINRETLRLMLKGEREIYTFELEKISQDLKVKVERILQRDIEKDSRQLRVLLQTCEDNKLSYELAEKIAQRAIGLSERVITENERGQSLYRLRKFEYACEIFSKLLNDAELMIEKYSDPEVFMRVAVNLIGTKLFLRDHTDLQELINKMEPHFAKNPKIAAVFCHSIAKLKELEGDFEGAREKYYLALEIFKTQCSPTSHATTQSTVVVFEYQRGNYEKAYEMQELVFQVFSNHNELYVPIIMSRVRAKILIRWNRMQEAADLLVGILEKIKQGEVDYSTLEAELYLLLAIATDDPNYAEIMIQRQIGTISIQKLAVKFLVDYFDQKEDTEIKSKYESVMRNMSVSPIDMLLREGQGTHYLLMLHDFCNLHNWHV